MTATDGHCRDLFAVASNKQPSSRTAYVKVSVPAARTAIVLVTHTDFNRLLRTMSSSATKAQSQKIFEKLKTKPANKVHHCEVLKLHYTFVLSVYRYASTAVRRTQRGLQYHSVYTCALTALQITGTWGSTSHS